MALLCHLLDDFEEIQDFVVRAVVPPGDDLFVRQMLEDEQKTGQYVLHFRRLQLLTPHQRLSTTDRPEQQKHHD